jgi:hypothetical protein
MTTGPVERLRRHTPPPWDWSPAIPRSCSLDGGDRPVAVDGLHDPDVLDAVDTVTGPVVEHQRPGPGVRDACPRCWNQAARVGVYAAFGISPDAPASRKHHHWKIAHHAARPCRTRRRTSAVAGASSRVPICERATSRTCPAVVTSPPARSRCPRAGAAGSCDTSSPGSSGAGPLTVCCTRLSVSVRSSDCGAGSVMPRRLSRGRARLRRRLPVRHCSGRRPLGRWRRTVHGLRRWSRT